MGIEDSRSLQGKVAIITGAATGIGGVIAFGAGFAVAALAWHLVRRAGPRWQKENRRGRLLPVTLGWALAIGWIGLVAVIWAQVDRIGLRASQTGEVLGAAIVFFAYRGPVPQRAE